MMFGSVPSWSLRLTIILDFYKNPIIISIMNYKSLTDLENVDILRRWGKSFLDGSDKKLNRIAERKLEALRAMNQAEAIEADRRSHGQDDFGGGFGPPSPSQIYETQTAGLDVEAAKEEINKKNTQGLLDLIERLFADMPVREKLDPDTAEFVQWKADKAAENHARTLILAEADTWPYSEPTWKNGYIRGWLDHKLKNP
jgi:hypothetical protein